MTKKRRIKESKYQKHDQIVTFLADKWALSPRHIRRIRDGKSTNDAVFSDYMALREWYKLGEKNLDNPLLEKVKELLPFN